MPTDTEPQSNDTEFYESHHEKAHEGGSVSPVQFADVEGASVMHHGADDAPVQRVTSTRSGAKREGFFRDRDYK